MPIINEPITYGKTKASTLKLIDEYSSRGAVQSATKVADYNLKIQSLTNATIYELASTTAKIPALFNIVHAPVKNNLSEDTSSIKQHLPGNDFFITSVGARATFFECTGPATVVIEESSNGGASYTPLETIIIDNSSKDFKEYKRLINPTLPTNTVRLRFTGDYIYFFRNYVLYPYTWPTEADIQQFRPWFEYPLPADYFEIDEVYTKRDSRQYLPYKNYLITNDKKIAFNRYDGPLELKIEYWRRPKLLTFTGVDATDDAQVIDLAEDAAIIIPWFVAGEILNSEQLLAAGTLKINQFAVKRDSLITNKSNYSSSILNVTGW